VSRELITTGQVSPPATAREFHFQIYNITSFLGVCVEVIDLNERAAEWEMGNR
jgi:hypothetical protein